MGLRCAECQCSPEECYSENNNNIQCKNCIKPTCCCIDFHRPLRDTSGYTTSFFVSSFSLIIGFLGNAKGLYAAALGIEILCIAAAEIGENTGLYLFGFNLAGIAIAYIMGYALAGFTTFVTIVGRFSYNSTKQEEVCSCCSVLEQNSDKGFMLNLKTTFRNFGIGIKKLPGLHRQPNLKNILKPSLVILVTAESSCILTAETVDLIFYKYSIFLSVPLALLAGAFTVMTPAAYSKIKAHSSLNF